MYVMFSAPMVVLRFRNERVLGNKLAWGGVGWTGSINEKGRANKGGVMTSGNHLLGSNLEVWLSWPSHFHLS